MSQQDFGEESKVRFQDDNNLDQQQITQSRLQDVTYNQDRTFVSQMNSGLLWKPFDFLFPAGKLAKLVRIYDADAKQFPWGDILYKLKLTEGFPVINLIGAKESGRGKFYAGIARAAFNCDAVVIDSAIQTGIEKYAIRRGIKLIGVAPENEIKFPKINPTYIDPMELSNGHSHLFLLNNESNDFVWTQEVWFKADLGLKIAEGRGYKGARRTDGKPRCKIVHVLLGDTPYYTDEVRLAVRQKSAIIVVKGSPLCNTLIKKYGGGNKDGEDQNQQQQQDDNDDNMSQQQDQQQQQSEPDFPLDPELVKIMEGGKGNFFYLDSEDSEDIAQFLHFLLTVTPWDDGTMKKPDVQELNNPKPDNNSDDENYNQQQQQQQQSQQSQGGNDQGSEGEEEEE